MGESEIPELSGEAEEEPTSQLPLAVLWGLCLPPPRASCPRPGGPWLTRRHLLPWGSRRSPERARHSPEATQHAGAGLQSERASGRTRDGPGGALREWPVPPAWAGLPAAPAAALGANTGFSAPQVRLWSGGDKALACSTPPSVWTPGEGGGPMGAAWSAVVWAPVAWSGTGRQAGTGHPTGERAQLPTCRAPRPPPTGSASLVTRLPSLSPPAQLTQPKPGAFVQRLHPPWPSVLTCRRQSH